MKIAVNGHYEIFCYKVRMATSGKMIEAIAIELAQPKARVTSYYSALRKAGYISTTGRGRSAQDLTSTDVARMMISMLVADSIDEVAPSIEIFQSLRTDNKICDDINNFEQHLSFIISCQSRRFEHLNEKRTSLENYLKNAKVLIETNNSTIESIISIDDKKYLFYNHYIKNSNFEYIYDHDELNPIDKIMNRSAKRGLITTRSIDHDAFQKICIAMNK